MKNVLIIAGSLALIGGGVYFYSKKKERRRSQKQTKLQALTEPNSKFQTTPNN